MSQQTPSSVGVSQPTYLTRVVAERLDYIADLIRAGRARLDTPVGISVLLHVLGDAQEAIPAVDELAGILGQPAGWDEGSGAYGNYEVTLADGDAWKVTAYTRAKRPASTEDVLRARVAELEAELAERTKPGQACRGCGATSGLVMRPYGPLDPPEYECTDRDACTRRVMVLPPASEPDPNRCPVCKHEAEHLIGAGCVARPGGQLGLGNCGCKHVAGGESR